MKKILIGFIALTFAAVSIGGSVRNAFEDYMRHEEPDMIREMEYRMGEASLRGQDLQRELNRVRPLKYMAWLKEKISQLFSDYKTAYGRKRDDIRRELIEARKELSSFFAPNLRRRLLWPKEEINYEVRAEDEENLLERARELELPVGNIIL
ncbi:hypothetical protein HOL34_01470 [bacterium]|nr:hypothetical protein [bacterium]MBT3903902.1 hypothetical protein [bacterium]MBT4577446.1 hypothetical protein [bacterium]MBT5345969.1 hypothetical protein [bacterium]MBT6130755.1 hypothetical protein [bacterium]